VVPGDLEASLLVARISAADPEERMPPPESGKALTALQVETLKEWIAEGARWGDHWAYVPPARPGLPAVRAGAWPRGPLDRFVLARLEKEGVAPSPEADRVTILRRLSFDLTGLPPTPEEIDAFLADTEDGAYERQVDRLLASVHYGERLAVFWLDLVRYADSRGYHSDNPRNVTPYREYVIQAFNDNLPFDRFTLEQLAGDLVPDPSLWQRVASCYNKLNQTTEEGGAQPAEYEAKSAADRVRNISVTWMGATLGCAECHEHKFDPYESRDFYTMAAFFADIAEQPIADKDEGVLVTSPEEEAEIARLDAEVAAARAVLEAASPELDRAQAEWEAEALRGAAGDSLPAEIRTLLGTPPAERDAGGKAKVAAHYRSIAPLLAPAREVLAGIEKRRTERLKTMTRCLVSVPGKPRTVRILPRGNWLDSSGEAVEPAIPRHFGVLQTGGRRASRLDLARWLVSRENPLTARVLVNRLWQLFFGRGISSRLDDLGAMGEPPEHPELLDWLAVELMDAGWDVKHVVARLVTSSTYRQSSLARPDLLQRDPYNRLLARQSRWRLDAEMVRDSALAVSGLLTRTVGGPSVKPYQPAGYWFHLNFPKREWENGRGEDLYRRGLYTWWQRSFLHPSLLAFDAPSREECTAERPRSNIPQQALVLLNDPTFVEAARVLSQRLLSEGGTTALERISWAWRRAVSREPEPEEAALLAALHTGHLEAYREDPAAARELVAVGKAPLPPGVDTAELAAWTSVARAILNLHETVTRN
jgi:hypothetical protein